MNALSAALVDIARSQNLKHLAIQEAARKDPKVDALHKIWLLATDTSEDEPRHVLNEVISRIEKLAKTALGLSPPAPANVCPTCHGRGARVTTDEGQHVYYCNCEDQP